MLYERITQKELDEMTLDNGITPNYTYDKYDVTTQTYINLNIYKTADEVYQEYLNNPQIPKPSEGEVLMSNIILENATLKQQMVEQQELTANLLLQIAELKGGNANV